MGWKSQLKSATISCGAYGGLKRAHRALFDASSRQLLRSSLTFYRQFISAGDLCFDIGSNVGDKTEIFLKLGARVVAFEPQPQCFREMQAKCRSPQLTAVNAAVGSKPGTLPMYVSRHHQASSLVPSWGDGLKETIQVPVTTLDHAIEEHGLPAFCKIDVEGYELEVLKGLTRAIPCLSLEYHLHDVDPTIACIERLSTFGELSINISLGEDTALRWPKWISYREFADYFPAQAPHTETCGFGDLFVRITPPC